MRAARFTAFSSLCLTFALCIFVLFDVSGPSKLLAGTASAIEDKKNKAQKIDELLSEAFTAEAEGEIERRSKLLADAAERFDSKSAKWHQGQILTKKNKWESIDQSIESRSSKLVKYEQFREAQPDNIDGHLAVARWCQSNRLPQQRRAHLERVLDYAPDHARARKLLGYEFLAGKWISPGQQESRKQILRRKKDSMKKYGRTVRRIASRLNSRDFEKRDAAAKELLEIRDSKAIGAVVEELKTPKQHTSNLVIKWADQLEDVEASLVIARYGLAHPNRQVRRNAVRRLRERPLHDFVPGLMGLLSTPIQTNVQAQVDSTGSLRGIRQRFSREGFEQKELLTFEQELRRDPRSLLGNTLENRWGSGLFGDLPLDSDQEEAARERAEEEIESRLEEMERQNARITSTNIRVANVMNSVTGQQFSGNPREMWQW